VIVAILRQINDVLGVFLATSVLILGIIENSSKIAKKPLTAIIRWLGIGKDKRIDAISKKLDEIDEKVDRNDIQTLKHRVLGIDLMIREGETDKISESQFRTAIEDLNKYSLYHEKYPELNGELKNAEQNIWNAYNHKGGKK
jgi:hypothetical protein